MFQEEMREQIAGWRDQNTISEMNDDVRTLYELLAGNTTLSQGRPTGPVEDRASTFSISEKYGFTWIQAFALSCWYGKAKNESVTAWVEEFQRKVDVKEESTSPDDDPLWVILKLFASMSRNSQIPKPVFPQSLSALESRWDAGAAFNIFHSITANLSPSNIKTDAAKAAELTTAFASQLESRSDLPGAIYALLHLEDPFRRVAAIQDVLSRHAASLPDHPDQPVFTLLTQTLHIPIPWLAKAKALFYRSTHDSEKELHYLILAQEEAVAHECLCKRVAPRLVIDEAYEELLGAVEMFARFRDSNSSSSSASKAGAEAWENGGGVYSDFVKLVQISRAGVRGRDKEKFSALLERCRKGLEAMGRKLEGSSPKNTRDGTVNENGSWGLEELEQRVAWREMGRVVAGVMEEAGGFFDDTDGGVGGTGALETSKAMMSLPLTGDQRRDVGVRLAVERYRKVMAGV
jgi:nuclear pore complex protein Nup98-Nup96